MTHGSNLELIYARVFSKFPSVLTSVKFVLSLRYGIKSLDLSQNFLISFESSIDET